MSVTGRTVDDTLFRWNKTKTWRKFSANYENRLSCSAGEHRIEGGGPPISFDTWDDYTLRQAKGESIAGAPLDERFRAIASRYGRVYEELGSLGPSYCKHTLIDPRIQDEDGKYVDFKIRNKYINCETPQKVKHTLGEIWKNVLFGEFLNKYKEIGWSLNRDWTYVNAEEPIYLVMIQGEESVKQRLQREQTKAPLDDLVKFVDGFSFDKDHTRKSESSLRNYVDLLMMSLKRYSSLSEEWAEKFEKIEDHIKGNLQKLVSEGKDLYENWVFSDGKTENIIYIKNGKKILSSVDQGQRKELLEDWLKKINPEHKTFDKNDYFECFWGAPHVYIGHMNFSIQIGEHIPESVKNEFAQYIEKFVETGRWNNEKKKGWNKDTANLAANLINLGELAHTVGTYYANRSPEWKALADTLMNTILSDRLYARFYPALTPIKNVERPPTSDPSEE